MTATFLVYQSGTVRLAFVGPDFTRCLDSSVVIARLKEPMSSHGASDNSTWGNGHAL